MIPSVASPIGAIRIILTPVVSGMLAATEDEWFLHLRELLESPALSEELGKAGRAMVESRFSLDRIAGEIERLLEQLDLA